eukprot:658055_1
MFNDYRHKKSKIKSREKITTTESMETKRKARKKRKEKKKSRKKNRKEEEDMDTNSVWSILMDVLNIYSDHITRNNESHHSKTTTTPYNPTQYITGTQIYSTAGDTTSIPAVIYATVCVKHRPTVLNNRLQSHEFEASLDNMSQCQQGALFVVPHNRNSSRHSQPRHSQPLTNHTLVVDSSVSTRIHDISTSILAQMKNPEISYQTHTPHVTQQPHVSTPIVKITYNLQPQRLTNTIQLQWRPYITDHDENGASQYDLLRYTLKYIFGKPPYHSWSNLTHPRAFATQTPYTILAQSISPETNAITIIRTTFNYDNVPITFPRILHELYQEIKCIKEENKTHKRKLFELQTQIQISSLNNRTKASEPNRQYRSFDTQNRQNIEQIMRKFNGTNNTLNRKQTQRQHLQKTNESNHEYKGVKEENKTHKLNLIEWK